MRNPILKYGYLANLLWILVILGKTHRGQNMTFWWPNKKMSENKPPRSFDFVPTTEPVLNFSKYLVWYGSYNFCNRNQVQETPKTPVEYLNTPRQKVLISANNFDVQNYNSLLGIWHQICFWASVIHFKFPYNVKKNICN